MQPAATDPSARATPLAPALFAGLFVVGLVLHFAVPWASVTQDGETTHHWSTRYMRAHEGGQTFFTSLLTPDPTLGALAGLALGLVLSLAWLLAVLRLPADVLTRPRNAAFAALLAVPLFVVAAAGGRAVGQTLQLARGGGFGPDVSGFSFAGVVLLGLAALAAVALAIVVARGTPGRGAGAMLLALAVVGVGAFHALPWMTEVPAEAEATTDHMYRDMLVLMSNDPLASLDAGLATLLVLAVAWCVAAGFGPGGATRARHLVDGGFGVALAAPALMAAMSVGPFLGGWLSSLLDADDGWVVSINAFVFLAFAAGLLGLTLAAVARSTAALEGVRA